MKKYKISITEFGTINYNNLFNENRPSITIC